MSISARITPAYFLAASQREAQRILQQPIASVVVLVAVAVAVVVVVVVVVQGQLVSAYCGPARSQSGSL